MGSRVTAASLTRRSSKVSARSGPPAHRLPVTWAPAGPKGFALVADGSPWGPLEFFASVDLGEAGIRVVGSEPVRGAVVDESFVQQPLDGSALGSNITKGVPRRDEFGLVFIEAGS